MQLGKSKFHKSHCFDFNADVPVFHGDTKPGIGINKAATESDPCCHDAS